MLHRRLAGLLVLTLVAGGFALAEPRWSAGARVSGEPAPPAQPAAAAPAPVTPRPAAAPSGRAALPAGRGGRAPAARVEPPTMNIRQIGFEEAPAVAARHVAILDEATGRVLYEKNGRVRVPIASVTKILTALVALERASPSDQVAVRFDDAELVDSTLMGILPGDRTTLEDLLYGLMLPSGNDAALAIAEHVAGSKAAFVELMNERAYDLGLHDSHFVNPHGLDVPDHYSTAYDMAVLSRYAMRLPEFRKLAAARQWTVRTQRGNWVVGNLNQLLWQYPGADGVKIGYEDRAGRTMVGSATRNDQRVYVALMNTTNLVADAKPLFEWVWRNFVWEPAG